VRLHQAADTGTAEIDADADDDAACRRATTADAVGKGAERWCACGCCGRT
jgi:hypothetical protein